MKRFLDQVGIREKLGTLDLPSPGSNSTLLNFNNFRDVCPFSIVMLDRFESGLMSPGHLPKDFLFGVFLCR